MAGRAGCWFTYNDGTDGGVQTPPQGAQCPPSVIPDGGFCGGQYAQHTFGGGFFNFGAGLGFDLNDTSPPRKPYDASKYQGLVFWALAPQGTTALPLGVDLQVLESATTPTTSGGTCTSATGCNDHYQIQLNFTSQWTAFTVPFSCLTQQSWGTQVSLDLTTLLGIQFVVNPAPAFDFWIYDIGFY